MQANKNCLLVASLLWMAMLVAPLSAAEWGDLSGTIVYDGDAAEPLAIKITKDVEVCGKHNLKIEQLVVDPETKGIANCIIYVYLSKKDKIDVHPGYAATAAAKIPFDNLNCRFEPRVVLLRTTQTLVIGNKDPVGHNTKVDTFSNAPFNQIVPANGAVEKIYEKVEKRPVPIGCNIHPWMNAWLVIKDNPYMAVTDETGMFEIKDLPTGLWTFQFWQEAAGYLSEVKVNGKSEKWKKGRPKLTIAAGENDLGTIAVAPALFEK